MSMISNLEPTKVFSYFERISKIPRCSGDEQAISDYLVQFAKDRELFVNQDEANNVIIKKPGTKGYENAPIVILQGHMDMVGSKNFDSNHNFETDPIDLLIEGDMLTANGTTLGADDGIAVAYCLAILDSDDIPHPPLEIIITTDEERGLVGAVNADVGPLDGKIFINIDNEDERELLVSCAGGARFNILLPIIWDTYDKALYEGYRVLIKGLKGGHSGADIHLNRANAHKLLGRVLYSLNQKMDCKLITVAGGMQDNAIPREAYAELLIEKSDIADFKAECDRLSKEITHEFKTSDSQIKMEVDEITDLKDKAMADATFKALTDLIMILPNGIQTMSADIEGLVESSLSWGVLQQEENRIILSAAVRSSVKSLKGLINEQLKIFANQYGASYAIKGDYPEWEYMRESKLRDICTGVYERVYNHEPIIRALHAGVECGVFAEKIPGIDMISIGPNLYDVHSPDERLSIPSAKKTWDFLLEVLKEIK